MPVLASMRRSEGELARRHALLPGGGYEYVSGSPQRGHASLHCSVTTTDAPGSVMIGERRTPNNGGLVLCSKKQRQRATAAVFSSSGAALRRAQRRASITTGAHKLALIVAVIDAPCPVAATGRRKKERDAARANHNESDAHLQCSVATGDAQIDVLTRREGGRAQLENTQNTNFECKV